MNEYYQATKKALESGELISAHFMLKDLEAECIWFDKEHAEQEIFKAIEEFKEL